MGLQWMVLTCVVAVETAIVVLLTLPWPRQLKSSIVALVSMIIQPAVSILPFAGFHLLDIHWKNEHRQMCSAEVCTPEELFHYEKSVFKAQRNVILCVLSCLLYWCICCVCKYQQEVRGLEEAEKRLKNQ
ncbi:uncharacterized protein LOC120282657 [Dioscorea cayenensis subsp. rotundata]|uniref:Endoplasmic reticulum transmembrane protein n=1 Tax=Dioscorea cayennensis subsp. rotundata TaxID=55577 RepID=A0AB40CZB7_DIOCR|nr:uncharacterized protein LOC120282657 [Dioscorea cayenensis subsp. rotundata]XP_039145429.1 uncharacterized protein LOC120282657 [Dioscorea cayenensis subsp. rotundata]XP_039145430.1 uncharacterized protein LOC120282657 [Dioscorea cayenensis subsp. rotundata]XP_039145431.1 uncharacterized protein LOC120282657 [Dioscorea cayenensis subsp. rotundata]